MPWECGYVRRFHGALRPCVSVPWGCVVYQYHGSYGVVYEGHGAVALCINATVPWP